MASRFLPAIALLVAVSLQAAATPEELEFFEKSIRPLLADNCYACHSSDTMAAADLRLDSAAATLAGGSRGPAIEPRAPDASLLIKAVSYDDLDLQMPPGGKLSDQQIADLRRWIEIGAPDPRQEDAVLAPISSGIDFDKEREFWAFRAISKPAPPAAGASPVDAFLNAKLREAGLESAGPADKRSLLRRVTFDLTGLPPTREEIAAFLADNSPDAYQKVVERLLASPAYGERWARHWLDLVRYAETNGHEFDNDKLDSWRYRDYVVSAFNQDLPYNVFVREQIAGDLLPASEQRLSADGSYYETPIGPGVFWLWEVLNSPTDSVKSRADQVDNQIDVVGKALFGLTIACARCHDHKFDPIPTADYYSLGGILHSTQLRERAINSPPRDREILAARDALAESETKLRTALPEALRARAATLEADLAQAVQPAGDAPGGKRVEALRAQLAYAATEPSHPYYPLARLTAESDEPFAKRLSDLRQEMAEWQLKARPDHPLWADRGDRVFEDFQDDYDGWFVEGAAFGEGPARQAPLSQRLPGAVPSGIAASHAGADEFVGILTTPTFRLDAQFVHVRMGGTKPARRGSTAELRVTIWADDHPSQNITPSGEPGLRWETVELTKENGRIGYVQITDRSRDGHIAVDRIVFSDSPEPPPIAEAPEPAVLALLADPAVQTPADLVAAYGRLAAGLGTDDLALLEELDGAPWQAVPEPQRPEIPPTAFAMSSMDSDPHDIQIHVRGNHKNLGETAPRRFLQIIAGEDCPPFRQGSGRLELADWAASEENPLTARVLVNRVWKHHFGRGIVATPDNFGQTGDRPTHPELLNWLAATFVEDGWSIKKLQRRIVLSQAYQRDSAASAQAGESDPLNTLLSHMPVRRLEAEAIRDSILAVSGSLEAKLGGPPVPPHISEHQDGRGKPESGPLDGEGRRSLYIGVRRNFLPPLFLAFDYPTPITTIGRRGVSAVPSQALILLNNKFVNQQAQRWAERTLAAIETPDARITDMFERAFGRLPRPDEKESIRGFLDEQKTNYDDAADEKAWTDLAHVLLNSTEFIFVR